MSGTGTIDIDYLAQLARLEIPPERYERLKQDMEAIVGYIAELEKLDAGDVEPTAHAVKLSNVWREDVAIPSFDRDVMLSQAPEVINGETVKVPQVLPGEGMN